MSSADLSRRKFLIAGGAATGAAGLSTNANLFDGLTTNKTLRVESSTANGRYDPGTLFRTVHGDVLIGDFQEVLSLPGRYLNDHCLIRTNDEWHFFGIVGFEPSSPQDDSRREESEVSFAHATSSDLKNWKVWPDVI